MDDAWMDGVMDFVGFPPKLKCFKARGRVGGSRRTWLKMVRERQPSARFCVVETQKRGPSAWSRGVMIA